MFLLFVLIGCSDDSKGLVYVEGGTYNMGDHFSEGLENELPLHKVALNDFYIGIYEVTQSEWELYMPLVTDSKGKGDNLPVYAINWYETLVYCNKRSIAEGLTPSYTINNSTKPIDWGHYSKSWNNVKCNWEANGYRLPTEAEWEYAARGGLTGQRFPNGSTISHSNNGDVQANYKSYWNNGTPYNSYDLSPTALSHPDYIASPSPVGIFPPNAYGLYDMSGNLREWCWDCYDGRFDDPFYNLCNQLGIVTNPHGPVGENQRVHRGGDWAGSAFYCRVSKRGYDLPHYKLGNNGFRVARTP